VSDLNDIKVNQWYERKDGAQLRIDRVAQGQVYFVAWLPNQDYGAPKRMTIPLFKEAIKSNDLYKLPLTNENRSSQK
jgi:hypothetical protein